MFEYLYEWILNIAYYLVLMTAIIQVIPSGVYEKYVKFYMGLIIVLMLCTPIIKVLGVEQRMSTTYKANTYRMEWNDLIQEGQYLGEVKITDYIAPEELEE